MTQWSALPGYVSEHAGADMPTVTIERERIRDACEHARDELGFDMCVDGWFGPKLTWKTSSLSRRFSGTSRIVGTRDGMRVPS